MWMISYISVSLRCAKSFVIDLGKRWWAFRSSIHLRNGRKHSRTQHSPSLSGVVQSFQKCYLNIAHIAWQKYVRKRCIKDEWGGPNSPSPRIMHLSLRKYMRLSNLANLVVLTNLFAAPVSGGDVYKPTRGGYCSWRYIGLCKICLPWPIFLSPDALQGPWQTLSYTLNSATVTQQALSSSSHAQWKSALRGRTGECLVDKGVKRWRKLSHKSIPTHFMTTLLKPRTRLDAWCSLCQNWFLPAHTVWIICDSEHNVLCQVQDAYVFDLVYSLCGNKRKDELLRSIHSLLLLIGATEDIDRSSETQALYRVHIITDGSVTPRDFSASQLDRVCYLFHKPVSKAASLFAPCSTQRLYLHEHPDFENVHEVIFLYLKLSTINCLNNPHTCSARCAAVQSHWDVMIYPWIMWYYIYNMPYQLVDWVL